MGETSAEVVLDLRAQHAEGPLWDAETARLWWVDIMGQRVHCSDPESGKDVSWPTPGQPGGVVLSTAGEPVIATPSGLAILDRTTGRTDLRVPIEQEKPENRANDIKVDSPRQGVGGHDGLRPASGKRCVVPRRRRRSDVCGG